MAQTQFGAWTDVGMGFLQSLGMVMAVAPILAGAYYLHIRRAFGETAVMALAVLLFLLPAVLIGEQPCRVLVAGT